jgi:hypothetical protein
MLGRKVYGYLRMSDINDGTTLEGSPDETGTETSPDQTGTPAVDPIALARKRQAGAEAARQQAEKEAKALRVRLEEYESANRTASDKDLADNAKLQERLAAAELRAEEAEAKAQARILDALYPSARKELPEVTDEVRLAKFEALLSEPDGGTPPTPFNPNESNRVATGDATHKPKEESSEDIATRLRSMTPPWL